jgi:rSAM/selenodomain-associated transferase 1
MSSNPPTILFFVRWPEPGRVKTRLAATVGNLEACRIHRLLAERCFRSARAVAGARLVVCGTGAPAKEFELWFPTADAWWEQPDGDLGSRLARMFASAFAEGAGGVCAIGSDAPLLGAEPIGEALDQLHGHDVSLLPATDGGYVLVALRRMFEPIFQEMPWSTSDLYNATLAVCAERGLRCWSSEPFGDIDTAEDWSAFLRMGASGSD